MVVDAASAARPDFDRACSRGPPRPGFAAAIRSFWRQPTAASANPSDAGGRRGGCVNHRVSVETDHAMGVVCRGDVRRRAPANALGGGASCDRAHPPTVDLWSVGRPGLASCSVAGSPVYWGAPGLASAPTPPVEPWRLLRFVVGSGGRGCCGGSSSAVVPRCTGLGHLAADERRMCERALW